MSGIKDKMQDIAFHRAKMAMREGDDSERVDLVLCAKVESDPRLNSVSRQNCYGA